MARGTPAVQALTRAKIAFTLHEYDFVATPGAIGLQAALAMGVAPSGSKDADGGGRRAGLVVAVIAVDRELDLKALAKAAGGKRAAMAEVARAERATGYVKGGISPFGQKKRHRTFLDATALALPTIIVNGGRRGLQIELAPADLLAATAGTATALARVI